VRRAACSDRDGSSRHATTKPGGGKRLAPARAPVPGAAAVAAGRRPQRRPSAADADLAAGDVRCQHSTSEDASGARPLHLLQPRCAGARPGSRTDGGSHCSGAPPGPLPALLPLLHRASGIALLAAAAAVVAGYGVMELGHQEVMAGHGPLACWAFYRPMAAWFAFTAGRLAAAVRGASRRSGGGARRQRAAVRRGPATKSSRAAPGVARRGGSHYDSPAAVAAAVAAEGAETAAAARRHAAYALRHAAAGLTFGLARLLVLAVGWAAHASGLGDMGVEAHRRACFYACTYGAAVVAVGGVELSLLRASLVGGGRRGL
jgi:hypothetical protein